MTRFGTIPPEPPVIQTVDGLAPKFRALLGLMLADMVEKGWMPALRETLRTDQRQAWLYGFGRDYDDGRGVVTNIPTAAIDWHRYGLAADVIDRRYGDDAPEQFWTDLEHCAVARGLASGQDWIRFCDKPHVQFGHPMRASPSEEAVQLYAQGGSAAVWKAVGALSDDTDEGDEVGSNAA